MHKLLVFLISVFLLVSCKKQEIKNIKQIIVSGVVYDSTNHSGMAGRLVKAYFRDDPSIYLATSTTDTHGNFTIDLLLDVNVFNTQTVSISTDVPAGYLSIFDKTQSQLGFGIWDYVPEISYQKLVLFKEADLAITLQRTQAELFTEMETLYRYSEWQGYGIPIIQFNAIQSSPITYHVKTAAGTYTKITGTKKLASGSTTTYKDSIFCLPNVSNSLLINY